MDQLTLTGATLVDTKEKGSVIEMTGHDHSHDKQQLLGGNTTSHNHNHNHNQSSHNHNHNHGGGNCCGPKKAPPVRVVYTPPSQEELLNAKFEDIRTSLETLIRLGGFVDAFEPLLKLIIETRPDAVDGVLNALGNDHYSLLHWAAKRSKLLKKSLFCRRTPKSTNKTNCYTILYTQIDSSHTLFLFFDFPPTHTHIYNNNIITKQNKTKQNKTKQNKTKQNKTKHSRRCSIPSTTM